MVLLRDKFCKMKKLFSLPLWRKAYFFKAYIIQKFCDSKVTKVVL